MVALFANQNLDFASLNFLSSLRGLVEISRKPCVSKVFCESSPLKIGWLELTRLGCWSGILRLVETELLFSHEEIGLMMLQCVCKLAVAFFAEIGAVFKLFV